MTEDAPIPVSGSLTRRLPDGTSQTIEMTIDEVKAAPDRYMHHELEGLIVTYSDGSRRRPYRFVETQIRIREVVDPDTGKTTLHF
jgi:hypothetical protein